MKQFLMNVRIKHSHNKKTDSHLCMVSPKEETNDAFLKKGSFSVF